MMNDEAAIDALLRQLVEAWNRSDGEAFGAGFDEDADYIVFNGVHLKGRQQIAAVHQQLFDTVLKGTRLGDGNTTRTLRFLSADVALVHTMGSLRRPGQDDLSPEQNSIQTFVLVKRGERWSIAAFQNTRIQPHGTPTG
jgi:uncharacterized protein (TIGR02246 family)